MKAALTLEMLVNDASMKSLPIAALLMLAGACSADTDAPANRAEPVDQVAAANSTGSVAVPANPDANTLTAQGWGPLRIGMTRQEMEAAAGPDADPSSVGGAEPDRCDQFRPRDAPPHLLVMVENGVLTRISLLRDNPVRTDDGIGLGDHAASVKAALGDRARVSPHNYVEPPAEYVDVWTQGNNNGDAHVDDPAARGIRYEVGGDGKVQSIHAGGPSIQYVEGCA